MLTHYFKPKKKKKKKNMNTLKNIPNDILVEIFSKVGKESATLLGNIKLRYKIFFFNLYLLIYFPLYKLFILLI